VRTAPAVGGRVILSPDPDHNSPTDDAVRHTAPTGNRSHPGQAVSVNSALVGLRPTRSARRHVGASCPVPVPPVVWCWRPPSRRSADSGPAPRWGRRP